MERRTFYNEIITDHNIDPLHKYNMIDANLKGKSSVEHCQVADGGDVMYLRGVNPSCGDDITLQLRLSEDGSTIEDGSFVGDGCAISQASADIMLDMIIGRSVEEALSLKDKFLGMIKGTASEEDIEALEEAGALQDISYMPSRVKCAVLGWHTLEEILK